MEILWVLGEGSVRDVLDRIDPGRELAYTTVMTVLNKMRKKGLLVSRKHKKAFIYSPAIDRSNALDAVVDHLTHAYFKGSRTDLLRHLARTQEGRRPAAARGESGVIRHKPENRPEQRPAPAAETTADMDEYLL